MDALAEIIDGYIVNVKLVLCLTSFLTGWTSDRPAIISSLNKSILFFGGNRSGFQGVGSGAHAGVVWTALWRREKQGLVRWFRPALVICLFAQHPGS